jgi:hypothetical protein
MLPPENLCEKGLVRVLALALSALVALPPAAWAVSPRTSVVVVPYAQYLGVPDGVAERVVELLRQDLQGREELKLVSMKAAPRSPPPPDPRVELGKAAQLAQKGRHAAAAESLQKAIALMTSRPAALDGQLLSDAALQLAVERLASGDEDGGDAALAQLVRLFPQRELNAADYPPAFLVELSGIRRRMLAAPRGSLRVLSPPGTGEARVFVDGRAASGTPLLVKDLIPGEHFVRVERAGSAWGEKVVVIAGVETKVAPQPGASGPAAELTGALLLGELDRAAVMTAGRLARAAGAQAAVFGAVLRDGDSVAVKSFLCVAKGDRLFALAPLRLDAELLGGLVQMVKLGDDVVAKLLSPPAEPPLPLSLAPAAAPAAVVEAAPAPVVALQPVAATAAPTAPESARHVAMPGAPVAAPPAVEREPISAPSAEPQGARRGATPPPVAAVTEPPSRALVIPRQPIADDDAPAPVRQVKAVQAPPQKRLEALEPDAIKTVRESPPQKSHTALWIVTGVVVAGVVGATGYFIYKASQDPTTATVNATWPH